MESFFSSARRFAAGESASGDDAFASALASDSAFGDSGDVEAGCDRGDGLLVRFSSGLPAALVSGVCSRAYKIEINQFTVLGAAMGLFKRFNYRRS